MHETNHVKESASNVGCCACMGCCYDPFQVTFAKFVLFAGFGLGMRCSNAGLLLAKRSFLVVL